MGGEKGEFGKLQAHEHRREQLSKASAVSDITCRPGKSQQANGSALVESAQELQDKFNELEWKANRWSTQGAADECSHGVGINCPQQYTGEACACWSNGIPPRSWHAQRQCGHVQRSAS